MGIPLLRGRLFTEHDSKNAPRVAIINETMAKQFFPDEDPIGKRIHVTNGPVLYREIVGIVGDVKQYGLDEKTPSQTYEPYLQEPFSFMSLVVRTAGDPTSLSAAIRSEVLSIDSEQPVSSIKTLDQILSTSIAQQRFAMLAVRSVRGGGYDSGGSRYLRRDELFGHSSARTKSAFVWPWAQGSAMCSSWSSGTE